MKNYELEIEGITPLLHHKMRDEDLMGLLGAKEKKKKVKEYKTPREIAESHAYYNEKQKVFYIPSGYISGAFIEASGEYKRTDSARKSYKSISGGIFRPNEEEIFLLDCKNKPIKNFEVSIMKATNHLKGAVAVCRPRFDKWKCKLTVSIDDTAISPEMVLEILESAGRRVGIGSFRVSKRGWFGQFQCTSWKEIK